MDLSHHNAVAGPSKPRQPTPPSPSLAHPIESYFPPPGPPPNLAYLYGDEDLLRKFQLLDAYDNHVKQYITPTADADIKPAGLAPPPLSAGSNKGKEKEIPQSPGQGAPQTPAADGGDDDDEAGPPGKKKNKKNYKHLIKDIPGKHSLKKDDYLFNMMQEPPKQRNRIAQFDMRTQTEAFTVTAGGIPGYNMKSIVKETNQAKEDRKKNREAKRTQMSLATGSALPTAQPSPAASMLPGTPGVTTPRPSGPSTPKSRAGSVKPTLAPVATKAAGTPQRIGTPTTGTPHPLSAAPLSAAPDGSVFAHQQQMMRGKKRERDEAPPTPAATASPYHATNGGDVVMQPPPQPQQPQAILGAKSGAKRPAKRPRMESRDSAPMQQPTPQNV